MVWQKKRDQWLSHRNVGHDRALFMFFMRGKRPDRFREESAWLAMDLLFDRSCDAPQPP